MNYKVVITGPVGSGKTTAVNSLTDKDAALTDAIVSDSDQITKQRKKTTTVAMDYDVIRLNDDNLVHVYGTPGQERFDFMWEILSKGAHGVILLLDNTRNYPFRDLKYYTQRFGKLIKASRLIIGITRYDLKQNPPIQTYQQWLKTLNIEADVLVVDAREKNDVTKLFYTLLDIKNEEEIEAEASEQEITETERIDKSDKETSTHDTKHEPIEENIEKEQSQPDNIVIETPPDEIAFNEKTVNTVLEVNGVNGATLSNSYGELLHSTIADEELNEFIAFLSGITPDIENTLNRGKINRIMLRSPHDDNLTVFVEKNESLGITSDRRKSVQALSQQIEDMLQWM